MEINDATNGGCFCTLMDSRFPVVSRAWQIHFSLLLLSRTWKFLGKGRFFKMALEKFWIFVWESLKYRRMDIT